MQVIIVKDAAAVGKRAADEFEKLFVEKPECVIGLATGSTPLELYAELAEREKAGKFSMEKVCSFNLDEYKGLKPDHPQSYRKFMDDNLFSHVSIKRENTFVPDGMAEDVKAFCESYEANIKAHGGVDIQLLGIGHDGHIGFNEPGDVFPTITHEEVLTDITRDANKRFFDGNMDEVPTSAITMGIGTVMAAKKLVMVVTGADKADIIAAALKGPVTPKVQGSIIQFHQDVVVICDEAAAAKL